MSQFVTRKGPAAVTVCHTPPTENGAAKLGGSLRHLLLAAFLASSLAAAESSPEVQLTLLSLRPAERARVEKAVGPIDELPLYRAQLDLDPARREISGQVFVTYVAKKPTSALYLRVNANLQSARVKLSFATVNGQPAVLEQPEPTLYRVKLDPALQPGTGAAVELKLLGKIPPAKADSDSLSMSKLDDDRNRDYGTFAAAPELISLVGLLPGLAPATPEGELSSGPTGIGDFGDFELGHWLVSISVPSGWSVSAPGIALGDVPEKLGKTRFSFGIASARDFVLLATKGYETATAKLDDITVESRYLASDKDAGKKVLKVATDALTEYQKRFGPYPYTTFRVVEARLSGGAGGMEFPGLVTVSTALYRGAADPLSALGMPGLGALSGDPTLGGLLKELKPMLESTLEFTVAHEVAHQWFAMMIGSDAVTEPVVDEPLTQHAALLYLEWKHGRASADEMRKAQLTASYHLMRMMDVDDGPANRPTQEFGSVNEYAALIYGKAPLYFDAARKLVGDEKYFKALRAYCDTYRWKTARIDSFTGLIAKGTSQQKELSKLKKRWWDEAKGDEDLGKPQVSDMFGGSGLPPGLDPNTIKMLEDAIRAMGGE